MTQVIDPVVRAGGGLSKRVVVLAVTAVAGAALACGGAYAAWTVNASGNSAVSATTASVTMVDANGGAFATAVADLVPGDYFYRYVNLTNTASSANTYAGPLAATGDLGPQILGTVETCSVPWTSPGGVSTCTGTKTTLLASTALGGAGTTVNYGSITTVQHVRYGFTFNTNAPQTLMGKAGTISAQIATTLVGGRDRTTG